MTNFMEPLLRRRRLLIAAAGVAAAGGALGLRLSGGSDLPDGLRLTSLSAREASAAARLASALLPPDTPFPNWSVAAYIDRYVGALGEAERTMLHGLLFALDQGTLLDGFWTPAHRMNRAQATRAFGRWERSGLSVRRDMAKGFRQLVGMAWLALPETRRRYGIGRVCGSGSRTFVTEIQTS